MSKKKTIICLNGKLHKPIAKYHNIIGKDNFIIAADGGAILLEKIKITPDIIIGDLDSLCQKKIDFFKNRDVSLLEFPVEKDKTDGELAIDYCKQNNFNKVIIIGSHGGRIDQQLANILLLEYGLKLKLSILIKDPGLEMGLITDHKIFENKYDWKLSLISLSKITEGLSIKGCKYEVNNENLFRYKTRGISNKINSSQAIISIKNGLLLYIINKHLS